MLHQRQNGDLRLDQARLLLLLILNTHHNLRHFRTLDHLHCILIQCSLIHTLPLTPPFFTYTIHRRETPLADLLTNVEEVLDFTNFSHLANVCHPLITALLARREELAVVRRREAHPKPEIPRVLARFFGDGGHGRLLHGHHNLRRIGHHRRIDVHELVVDSHEALLHPVERGQRVQLSAELLHVGLCITASSEEHIHAWNFHTGVHFFCLE